ncbi:hypothetical protein M422DRAFT_273360 [Sphaerobolus stellatus SS14]|uniref:Uncharacterized protein n=1 Tax=Sphaerobolus stellatus (strain SS14) TaxID=990650 RepID=A0A0C9UJW0_SPHS4|nr:hypothetical protein M422DRAFT_273360 [Sphaerobolus stellatus SS14]
MVQPRVARLVLKSAHNRCLSTTVPPPRPFKFHIGASFANKPEHPRLQAALNKDNPGFLKDSPIGLWRDSTLNRKKAVSSTSAGEDFFFIQENKNGSVGMPYIVEIEQA